MKESFAALANSLTKKTPYKGPGADSEEKHEPASDINTEGADSLKALDPNGRLEKQTLRLRASRSDVDPRVRPLKPTVGGGQISGAYRRRTSGPGSSAKSSLFSEEKPHFGGRKLQSDLSAQADVVEEAEKIARLELFQLLDPTRTLDSIVYELLQCARMHVWRRMRRRRVVGRAGNILCRPIFSGLHHDLRHAQPDLVGSSS